MRKDEINITSVFRELAPQEHSSLDDLCQDILQYLEEYGVDKNHLGYPISIRNVTSQVRRIIWDIRHNEGWWRADWEIEETDSTFRAFPPIKIIIPKELAKNVVIEEK